MPLSSKLFSSSNSLSSTTSSRDCTCHKMPSTPHQPNVLLKTIGLLALYKKKSVPHTPHFFNPPPSRPYQFSSNPHPALSLLVLLSSLRMLHLPPIPSSFHHCPNDLNCNVFSSRNLSSLSIHTPRFTRPSLKVISFNAHSLIPMLDELSLFCSTYHPDLICVNETRLSSDILNSEIAIQNFQLFRLDRTRHGGVSLFMHTLLYMPFLYT